MNFEQLRYFTEVYRTKSLTEASENLHISRQALSGSMKNLENELCLELFTRTTSGVQVTENGEEVYQSVKKILDEWEYLKTLHMSRMCQKKDCRIAIYLPFTTIIAEEIVDKLSYLFRETRYFIIPIKSQKELVFVENADIIITCVALSVYEEQKERIPEGYNVHICKEYEIYIWLLKELLQGNIEEFVSSDIPEKLKGVVYRGKKGIVNGWNLLTDGWDMRMAETKAEFIDCLKSGEYYAWEYKLDNELQYESILNTSVFSCYKSADILQVRVIYKEEYQEYVSHIIQIVEKI